MRSDNSNNKKSGSLAATLLSAFGTLIIIAVIVCMIPLAVPKLLGYQTYDVVSGSMEPEIPIGSLVLVKSTDPAEVAAGDVIAFYGVSHASGGEEAYSGSGDSDAGSSGAADDGASDVTSGETSGTADSESAGISGSSNGAVVTHRVVENDASNRQFITKGDANQQNDMNPVPYGNLIGRVEKHYPVIGGVMAGLTTGMGKIYLLMILAAGVILNFLAGKLNS